jgi:hypothetical protein
MNKSRCGSNHQPAPAHVVKENLYSYDIEASDSQFFADDYGVHETLNQSYKIEGIVIAVKYNMTDVDIQGD